MDANLNIRKFSQKKRNEKDSVVVRSSGRF